MKTSLVLLLCFFTYGCKTSKSPAGTGAGTEYHERPSSKITLTPGMPAYNAATIRYHRAGTTVMNIQLKEPVVVAVASKPEKWGFFQFPTIARNPDGTISMKWNLNADAMEAYGQHKFGTAISKDGGKTWQPSDKAPVDGALLLPNGDRIAIHTPKPIKVDELKLPEPLSGTGKDTYSRSSYTFYKLHDLPQNRQGVFLDRLPKGETTWNTEQASLNDPLAARYSLRGQMPVVWWGDMHLLQDGSVMAGVYPGFLIDEARNVDPRSGSFFYKSTDNGRSWTIQGRIPYVPDLVGDSAGYRRMGFTEPAFEVLKDGTFICILRTTDGVGNGPMYISRSTDQGVTWSTPEIMTPSGVLPRLLQLKNGVVALSSGRPGVQLRFSSDGRSWTDPIEMLPYKDYNDQVSCGYTGLLETGPDRFLVVYSDFRYLNEAKEERKAIKVREVVVTPR